ncbi:hypothetical protein PTTG_01032, partial [Puccinia triticina 1-1 BBBD Race 1]
STNVPVIWVLGKLAMAILSNSRRLARGCTTTLFPPRTRPHPHELRLRYSQSDSSKLSVRLRPAFAQNPRSFIAASVLLVASGTVWAYYRSPSRDEEMKADRYRPFHISNSKLLTADAALIGIDVSLPALEPVDSPFYIESVYVKHPAVQIERPYTPLSSITPPQGPKDPTDRTEDKSTIELLVKRYQDGDMSTYLHHIKTPGNQLEIRGPVPTWWYPKGEIDELVFIAAGTGITPAIQLLRRTFQPLSPQTPVGLPNFQLIYLARSLESAYLLDEIQSYQSAYPESMNFKLLVADQASNQVSSKLIDKVGRLELSDIRKWVGSNNSNKKKMIIVCGPDSLICAVAGCKGPGYNSQGDIGGMLKTLGYSSDQVVKL